MCGRTACTLAPDDVVKACQYQNRQGRRQRPVWRDPPGGQQYYPSHNVAPASHTPVLLSSKHYPGELDCITERVVQPMKWGLVPPWHKGDPYKLEYDTNNCRAEGMLSKRTYKVPLEKGQRCVVLADGFFEWKRTKDLKQPYFIYPPPKQVSSEPRVKTEADSQTLAENKRELEPDLTKPAPAERKTQVKTESVKPDPDHVPSVKTEPGLPIKEEHGPEQRSPETKFGHLKSHLTGDMDTLKVGQNTAGNVTNDDVQEWHGKPLLKMAGVFDVWHPPDGSEPLYSYSVITVEASPAVATIHHRMPAILSTDEEVSDWLDFSEISLSKAVKSIHPTETIQMHMVSPMVNNSRNKSPDCVEPYNPKEVKKSASSNLMMSWLSKGKSLPAQTGQDSAVAKKLKLN